MTDTKAVAEDYKHKIINTVIETYPKYIQQKFLADLEKRDIVKLKKTKISKENSQRVDLSNIREEEQLLQGLQNDNVLRALERHEFLKSYKSAVIFTAIPTEQEIFNILEEEGGLQNFFSPEFVHDKFISNGEIVPTIFILENVYILKFSKMLSGFTPSGIRKEMKYNIIGVYFKHLNILEIRFDNIKNMYQNDDEFFYHKQIDVVIDWFREVAKFEINNINLPPIIQHIKMKDQDEVFIYSQAMSMTSGAKAELHTGQNGNIILPLIGELKELMKVHEELFNDSPQIKDILDMFISETESSSDLPWISLMWKGNDKNDGTIVKFKHNYLNKGYTLLNYYGRQSDMRKMDYVTKYIIDNRDEFEKIESATVIEAEQTTVNS